MDRRLQRAAESLFPGENDLVVDTASMAVLEVESAQKQGRRLSQIPRSRLYDFGGTDSVYHTNYFLQAKTSQPIGKWLGV